MTSLTLPQFEKKYKQKFPAMRNTNHVHEPFDKHNLIPVLDKGWENIWECTNSGCHLMIVAKE